MAYDQVRGYMMQVDAAFPSTAAPAAIVSTTYTQPDTKGHSNENKLQLKVGELALIKNMDPECRVALAIGGQEEAWLPYVLKAFEIFFDEVLFLWTEAGRKRLRAIGNEAASIPLKNGGLWRDMKREWSGIQMAPAGTRPPVGLVRYQVMDLLKRQQPRVNNPHFIENEIARLCMERSYESHGAEWESYLRGRWQAIEMSRNYFNPVEAAVEITLKNHGFRFDGGIARNIQVPSLLHSFGMKSTRVAEDFVLHSKRSGLPVYIQCKSSGGGRAQHGKNIQNRAKEQITRSILYRCTLDSHKRVEWGPKRYHWVGVMDGDWGATAREPLKYIHMLQWAGYEQDIAASSLLDRAARVLRTGNPLADYLMDGLDCQSA